MKTPADTPPAFATSTLLPTKQGLALPTTVLPTVTQTSNTAETAPTPDCEDRALLIADVTIPDNTRLQTGETFTKTWKLQNAGTCTWIGYSAAFLSGDKMDAPDAVPLAQTAPKTTVDVSVELVAPANDGAFTGIFELHNAAGQVVGVNTAIIDDAQNVGFALAIDSLRPLIDDLKAGNGEVTGDTPRLGVSTISVEEVEPAVLEQFEVQTDTGAFVSSLLADSAANEAGVQEGDVIVAVDGEAIETSEELTEAIRGREVGDEIELRIERAGEELTLTAELRGQ